MANTSAIRQQAAHTTYQLSTPSCSTRAIQKSLTLNEKYFSFLEKSQENGPLAEKWQDKKSKRTRQKNKTRKEIGTWNQMTALRFQTEGVIRHPRPPFRVKPWEKKRGNESLTTITIYFIHPSRKLKFGWLQDKDAVGLNPSAWSPGKQVEMVSWLSKITPRLWAALENGLSLWPTHSEEGISIPGAEPIRWISFVII